jgi:hypothetical protein
MITKRYVVRVLVAIIFLYSLLVDGCLKIPEPIDYIEIFKERQTVPPSFGLGAPINPHPEGIQETFSKDDRMFIGLVISEENKNNVTFNRYTFYNRETEQEKEIPKNDGSRLFKPGQITLVAFDDPWLVPEQPGIYEFRVYLDNEIVASAVFKVR